MTELLSKFARIVFIRAQKIMLPPALVLGYVFGVGPLAAVARLSAWASKMRAEPKVGTFWKPARGYSPDAVSAQEQS